jgi:hypothetical protein
MTTISQSARGASAYSQNVYRATDSTTSGFAVASSADESWHEWARIIDELLAARNLPDDWDGQGAVAPHPALVDGAITLAQHFQAQGIWPPDNAIPSVNGTILFEWHGPVEYVEIEVTAPERATQRTVKRNSDETQINYLVRCC